MATIYVDLERGSNTQTGYAPVRLTSCAVTAGSADIAVSSAAYLVVGMAVLSGDMNNSAGLFPEGTVISSISGTTVTASQVALSSSSATIVFSPALKTINAATAKATVGDTIRVKESEVTNTGLVGNWSSGSSNLSFSGTQPYQVIDQCETVFNSTTDLTQYAFASVHTTTRMQGSASAAFNFHSNRVGTQQGRLAYKELNAPLDLSAYQQLSFYRYLSYWTSVLGDVYLDLCSDAQGLVPVNSILLVDKSNAKTVARWTPVVVDLGAPMGSQIRSIAIRRVNGTGSTTSNQATLYLDNIVACKANSDPTCITINSALANAANATEWYNVAALEDNNILIGSGGTASIIQGTTRGYYGASEAMPIYRAQANVASETVNYGLAGSREAPSVLTGGWSAQDMATRTGRTLISNDNAYAVTLTKAFWSLENFNFIRPASTDYNINAENITVKNCCFFGNSSTITGSFVNFDNVSMLQSSVSGNGAIFFNISKYKFKATNCRIYSGAGPGVSFFVSQSSATYDNVEFNECEISNNALAAIDMNNAGISDLVVRGGKMIDNGSPTQASIVDFRGQAKILDVEINPIAPVAFNTNSGGYQEMRFHNFNGAANDHRVMSSLYEIRSETTIRHTNAGLAWKLMPRSLNLSEEFPLAMPIAQILCASNKQVTASVWLRRDAASIVAGLRCKGGQINGVDSDVISYMDAAGGTWQQVSISFTPTELGVVELEVVAFGGTTFAAWCDDFSVVQE